MDPNRFFDGLRKQLKLQNDTELGRILCITQGRIGQLRQGGALDEADLIRLVSKVSKTLVLGHQLEKGLKKKFGVPNSAQLAAELGMTHPNLNYWLGRSHFDAQDVVCFVKAVRDKAIGETLKYPVKAIVEYYPISRTEPKKRHYILDREKKREKKIIDELAVKGVYIFYNSQGVPIYVGKAKKLDLWAEINNAYNRDRDAQVARLVSHPRQGTKFKPAYESSRQIRKKNVYLHEIAHFFSAYQAEKEMINNLEAFLIRAFANSLTNDRVENFHR